VRSDPTTFETRTAAIATHIDPSINVITTAGDTTPGDGGGATYRRVTTLSYPVCSFKEVYY
jgi:hypothetical protein